MSGTFNINTNQTPNTYVHNFLQIAPEQLDPRDVVTAMVVNPQINITINNTTHNTNISFHNCPQPLSYAPDLANRDIQMTSPTTAQKRPYPFEENAPSEPKRHKPTLEESSAPVAVEVLPSGPFTDLSETQRQQILALLPPGGAQPDEWLLSQIAICRRPARALGRADPLTLRNTIVDVCGLYSEDTALALHTLKKIFLRKNLKSPKYLPLLIRQGRLQEVIRQGIPMRGFIKNPNPPSATPSTATETIPANYAAMSLTSRVFISQRSNTAPTYEIPKRSYDCLNHGYTTAEQHKKTKIITQFNQL